MKNRLILMGLVLGMTTSLTLAQENDRAPRRLGSPRDAAENQDAQLQGNKQHPRAAKEQRREAKRMQKGQRRADLAPLPPGSGMGGPGFRGGQGFQAPGRGQAFNRPWNAPKAGNAHLPAVCPECGRPLGPMAGRGLGRGAQSPQGRGFGGPGLGANREPGRGMGPYAFNNQGQFGPRAGMGPMNRPPQAGQGQFRGGRQFGGPGQGPGLAPRPGAPDRQAPMLRDNDDRPPLRDQDAPRRRPNGDRGLRDQGAPRPDRGDLDAPLPPRDREE